MTGSIIPLFEGHDIRVLEQNGELLFPLEDLASAWGVDRKTPANLIGRNKDLFEGMFRSDGDVTYHDVNEKGLYLLMGKISADRLKNPKARDAMIRFQRWVPELIQKYRKHDIIPAEQKDIDTLVQQHLHIADAMAQFAHVDRGIAVSVALARVEYDTGADLTCYKNLIRKDRQQAPGYLTPTQIGQELGGLSARTINQMLQQLGYQDYLGDRWQPTKIGENYGENMPFAVSLKNGGVHSDYQLKWSPEMVRKLRDHVNGTAQITGKV
jgi:prophage antirepressor-like protein